MWITPTNREKRRQEPSDFAAEVHVVALFDSRQPAHIRLLTAK
ncbi:hypothetical protein Vi05172_g8043 [Venturia inaequalis]|nr:hypothetical protein Vi05172_g8043 [Venturia inaequalis]